MWDDILVYWEDSEWSDQISFVNNFDYPNQPYNCTQWGDFHQNSTPLIINDDDLYVLNDLFSPDASYPYWVIIDYNMIVRYSYAGIPLASDYNIVIQEIIDQMQGCTDPEATNYNSNAIVDDGSCEYNDNWVYGCTYDTATNYNPDATFDDGSCEFLWGDMNHDGTLNVQDVIFLVNAILSGDWF